VYTLYYSLSHLHFPAPNTKVYGEQGAAAVFLSKKKKTATPSTSTAATAVSSAADDDDSKSAASPSTTGNASNLPRPFVDDLVLLK